ncbi:MAG: epimerase [Candidatus Brocadia sp.]|uniref:dTDP-glucose 4,6-dehydratase n=1 Tax=Candidatus Brocadia fulgida TaxID=380242 RepID=A0A0M2UYT7_9BACT|nr:MAG: dTDP-glucose 4,6-dehydratase [Candidatus Brocadia fulgida]MCC6325487.1 GDP-mannose 4,6-dehydratase [Candidatus Brocadia sp.]MCE7910201.1 NAD-dependent epimerase/dehydratase family protein [Candidatus Brocadia sp. AMX3]MBV6517716.1 UDP-N-acetylglucosamine 4-epimerase [Candidatus Brocadia fulgida]MDG5996836.1 NAD-dependent epimerase/dehydratase family protein [Candidatus Brocadia sp.]
MNIANHYLITGGCGFIGTSLIARLRGENPKAKIRVLDNLSVGTKDDLAEVCNFVELSTSRFNSQHSSNIVDPSDYPEVELIIGDVKDYNTCSMCCRDIDCIVHLAANTGVGTSVENPRRDMEANVIGTFNMLEAARQNSVGKFIFASSGAPVGEVDPPIHEEKAPRPVSPYGASKLAGEGYCSVYYRTFGIKTISLRFGNVYGPLSKHKNSVVAKFIKQALKGETLEIYGDGKQTRDFIYIDDLVMAIMLASMAETGGEVFQIATYKETTVNEIARVVKELVERKTGKKVNIVFGNHRPGDVKRNFSDISKARKILGFEPRYDLMTGLRKTFESFFQNA